MHQVEQTFCQEIIHSIPVQMTKSPGDSVHQGIAHKQVAKGCSQQAYVQAYDL